MSIQVLLLLTDLVVFLADSLQKELHNLDLAILGGNVDGVVAFLVFDVTNLLFVDEDVHDLKTIVTSTVVKYIPAVGISLIHVYVFVLRNELRHHLETKNCCQYEWEDPFLVDFEINMCAVETSKVAEHL